MVCILEDYERLKSKLTENKVSFYTFTFRKSIPYSVVIRGFSDTLEDNKVLEYLKGLQIDVEILRIRKLGGACKFV